MSGAAIIPPAFYQLNNPQLGVAMNKKDIITCVLIALGTAAFAAVLLLFGWLLK